ncbi:hypothetical protein IWQ60_012072 [Tieghemiomyces parasiticus]|uniref:FHA domain-containing protein n=1 Tax=Tieghemiomyces parasiticus TaxID=78921 RepID=A0A9W7ZM24_9FUNG|nr:hypothetical protein IWQ60_012072 [Tieghemiomyces parasiticus]
MNTAYERSSSPFGDYAGDFHPTFELKGASAPALPTPQNSSPLLRSHALPDEVLALEDGLGEPHTVSPTTAGVLPPPPSSPRRVRRSSSPKLVTRAQTGPPAAGPTITTIRTLVGDRRQPILVGRGRRTTLDLTRNHREVSRRHATIRWCEADRFELEVIGRNGVKVDGQLFPAGATVPLHDGQLVDFVGVRFTFRHPVLVTPVKRRLSRAVAKASAPPAAAVSPTTASTRELPCVTTPAPTMNSTPPPASATDSPSLDASPPPAAELLALVVEVIVFSAKRSHTVADIYHALVQQQHGKAPQGAAEARWRLAIQELLAATPCFGRVVRRSKDATNRTADDLWYYEADQDADPTRRAAYGSVVRTARRCTLKDTQYYFKPVPKHKPLKKWIYVQEKPADQSSPAKRRRADKSPSPV